MATGESIVSRLSLLPVVTSAYSFGLHYYDCAKSSNAIVKKALETAEVSVKMAADMARPLVNKIEKPIAAVDSLACKALSKLQERYPSVNKTPEEITAETKTAWDRLVPSNYASVKEYGFRKWNSVKDYSVETASTLMATRYGEAASRVVNDSLFNADKLVDYLMPSESECVPKLETDDTTGTKLKKLSTKVGNGMVAKAQNLQAFHKKIAGNSFKEFLVNASAEGVHFIQTTLSLTKQYGGEAFNHVSGAVTRQTAKASSLLKTYKASHIAREITEGSANLTAS